MQPPSPCLCRKCGNGLTDLHYSHGSLPGPSYSPERLHRSGFQKDSPFEPIDPFKPSLSYSLRHIFPSKGLPPLDPDPVVAALLSPCVAFSSSWSSRRNSPRGSSEKSTNGHTRHESGHHNSDTHQWTPRAKKFTDPHIRFLYSQRGANSARRSPHTRPPTPALRSPSVRVAISAGPRSDSSHPRIAIEGPATPTSSASESVIDDVVRSYSQDLSSAGSPTLFSGSVASGMPPIIEDDDFTPVAPVRGTNRPISPSRASDRYTHSGGHPLIQPPKLSPETSDHDHEDGVTLSIRSEHLYSAPRLHSPPKARRKSNSAPKSLKGNPPEINSRDAAHNGGGPTHGGVPAPDTQALSSFAYILVFIIDTVPRQLYLYLMLCIPYMYFSRVANIFEESELSLPKIKRGIIEAAFKEKQHALRLHDFGSHTPAGAGIAADIHRAWRFDAPSTPSIAYFNLQKTWETFVDSLMSEWQTLNLISVLLMSAIIAILQIAAPANDAVTRYLALASLICALLSLIYGCVYIIRFGSMRKAFKAAMWAAEAQRSTTCLLWNVWVFLAMPATWLAWSMILFIACIVSLIWRTGTVEDSETMTITLSEARVPRIVITLLLSIGLVYFVFILRTLRRYGNAMDRKWHRMVAGWISTHQQQKCPPSSKSSAQFSSSRYGSLHRAPRTPIVSRADKPPTSVPRSTSTKSSWYV